MGDYIDRKEYVNRLNDEQIEYDKFYKGLGKAKVIADEMPSVDAVEVVRCKDCKHNIMNRCYRLYKTIIDDDKIFKVENTDFCKWGVKE